MRQCEIDRTAAVFYRTWRAGACRLSDGGGPFGFDIAVALLADGLISGFGCDAIAETGCFLGDTTAYLEANRMRLRRRLDTDPVAGALGEEGKRPRASRDTLTRVNDSRAVDRSAVP